MIRVFFSLLSVRIKKNFFWRISASAKNLILYPCWLLGKNIGEMTWFSADCPNWSAELCKLEKGDQVVMYNHKRISYSKLWARAPCEILRFGVLFIVIIYSFTHLMYCIIFLIKSMLQAILKFAFIYKTL